MKTTKQGVRDLNSSKQKNERRRPDTAGCFHDWEHDPTCPCTYTAFDDFRGSCYERCRKCGEPRRS